AFANGDGPAPGTSIAQFVVTLTDANGNPSPVPLGQTITVNFNTQDGTATASTMTTPGDYNGVTGGVLVFSEFESQKSIFITVNEDQVYEGDEQFQVTISSTQGTVEDGTAVGNILEAYEVASTRDASGQGLVRVFDLRTNVT